MSLLHRSPAYFESVQQAGQSHYLRAVEESRVRYQELRTARDPETFEEFVSQIDELTVQRSVLTSLPRLIFNQNVLRFMAEMTWFTIDAEPDCPTLLLSDDPLARTNGLKQVHGHMALPLTPTKMLFGTHTRELAREVQSGRRRPMFAALNTSTVEGAREFVAAYDGRQTRFIENRFGSNLRNALVKG